MLASMGLFAVGCSGNTEPPVKEYSAALYHATSCADLEQMLKQDATAKMNAYIDATIVMLQNSGNSWGGFDTPTGGVDDSEGNSSSVGTGGGPVPPQSGNDGSGGASGGGSPSHSDTNTQVEGVDEADIVKTDGNNIYLLHGQSLQVLSSWPVSSLGIAASISIEGNPTEMFVDGERAVIYSQVDGTDVYKNAGVPVRNPYNEGYGYYDGPAYDGYYNPYGAPLTKITVLSLSGGQPSVQKELYF